MKSRRLATVAAAAGLFAALFAARAPHAQALPQPAIIVDTDAGLDDLMALAFLLSRPDARIEAITIVNGNADVEPGTRNVLRVLALAGRADIPVYRGASQPLPGTHEFPAAWRKTADDLPGVTLPPGAPPPQRESAAEFLSRRFAGRKNAVRVLALGPLTNLAQALDRVPAASRAPIELVVMGGALRAPGNLGDGGAYKTDNTTAEWNFYADPAAAAKVFSQASVSASGAAAGRPALQIRVVPLDVTNKVPVNAAFVRQVDQVRSPLGRLVSQILAANRDMIQAGIYYAWDPLAAVALIEPSIVQSRCMAVEIRLRRPEEGRLVEVPGKPANACIALGADAAAFSRIFLDALRTPAP